MVASLISNPVGLGHARSGQYLLYYTIGRFFVNQSGAITHQTGIKYAKSPRKKRPANRSLSNTWDNTLACVNRKDYSLISITTPEPTVRPPSRIAKRRPFSIAMGVISSTSMSTLSPGMHISVPSGRVMMPVTSVVRK